ncbi:hypothetical protein DZC73_20125 [Albitalea terrae]|uniref:Uncharacterized protein n=2 Tax=Piscinibacter terrae TaxID=2496871 RepID=A0A3N7HMN3_9BURK|nr:hypothetical protein DZC73_20125 [Albitalea terrae]
MPSIQWAIFNASDLVSVSQPVKIVYFSRVDWQEVSPRSTAFAAGRYPDLLVGNPYAFQIKVNLDLNAFSILDSNSVDIVDRTSLARVNVARADGSYPNPGDPSWKARPATPADRAVAGVELSYFCNGSPSYESGPCSVPRDLALLVTISPPRSGMVHGAGFEFTLVYKSSSAEQRTRFRAIYVEKGKCKVLSMNSGPETMLAFESRAINWFINDCYAYSVDFLVGGKSQGELALRQAEPPEVASQHDLNGSTTLVVPAVYSLDVVLKATDAMGRAAMLPVGNGQSYVQHHEIAPCSINKTDPRCESRCSVTNPPADCPRPIPSECPDTADHHKIMWKFDVVCGGGGTLSTYHDTEPACSVEDAQASVQKRLLLNCRIVRIVGPLAPNPADPTGTMSPMCAADAPLMTKDFCLRCSPPGPEKVTESGTGCGLGDAELNARSKRPIEQQCFVLNEGECMKEK